ncbi:MAG: YIP1 family protein [Acidobacteriota bacterium]
MTPQSDHTPAGADSPSTSLGVIGRLTGIYFSPGETYPIIGRAPKFILPIILMGIVGAISSFALTHRIGYESMVRKQMESMVEKGWLTPEIAEEQIRKSTTGTAATVGKLQGPIGAGIVYALVILIMTALFKLISMIVGAESDFKPLLGVTAWTFLALGILQLVLLIIVIYLKPPDEIDMINPVGSNLGALLSVVAGSTPKFVKALATWVDVFGIWRIFLLSIGYAAVSRKLSTGTAAAFLIALYLIAAVIFSALAAAFM